MARIKTTCDACGITDDHPRHLHLFDMNVSQSLHMDCCRERGCPDGSCDRLVAQGADSLRGRALIKHITEGN